MAYVKYNVYFWSPPTLTPEQEIEVGRQIALKGRDYFRQQLPYLSEAERHRIEQANGYKTSDKIRLMIAAIFLFGGLGYMMLNNKKLAVSVLIAMALILPVSVGTLLYSRFSYHSWIDRMLAKYATHMANGGDR